MVSLFPFVPRFMLNAMSTIRELVWVKSGSKLAGPIGRPGARPRAGLSKNSYKYAMFTAEVS